MVLSSRELCCCLVEIASVDCVSMRRVVTYVAFYEAKWSKERRSLRVYSVALIVADFD